MAVMLETSKGDIVLDLYYEQCPVTCKNFVWLCKIKYYNNCLFHYVQRNFLIQSGDPTGSGKGGDSIYGKLYGEQARFFEDEINPLHNLKHKKKGVLGMANPAENMNASQFYITTGENLDSLDEKHTIFGEVGEGLDVVLQINNTPTTSSGRPLLNIRIWHTHILFDPWEPTPSSPLPPLLLDLIPPQSPPPELDADTDYLEADWKPKADYRPNEVIEEEIDKREAQNRAVQLELVGDIPEAEVKPPSNMLFVCKLNPVTTEEDLEIIFSRFGTITSCDVIRDWKTGDSLCYAFLGFDNNKSSEEAYFKMNNCIIDDRRIKVDFSQSVYTLWRQYRKFGKKGGGRGGQDEKDELENAQKGRHKYSENKRNKNKQEYSLLLDLAPEESDYQDARKKEDFSNSKRQCKSRRDQDESRYVDQKRKTSNINENVRHVRDKRHSREDDKNSQDTRRLRNSEGYCRDSHRAGRSDKYSRDWQDDQPERDDRDIVRQYNKEIRDDRRKGGTVRCSREVGRMKEVYNSRRVKERRVRSKSPRSRDRRVHRDELDTSRVRRDY